MARATTRSMDYRYRNYDNSKRRDDSDLRWNGAVNRSFGENNLAIGLRGRVSYRGGVTWQFSKSWPVTRRFLTFATRATFSLRTTVRPKSGSAYARIFSR